MSKSILRSVSPVHLRYLKNMRTQATLTISLIREGMLWGMIACHHGSRKKIFHEVRLACELIGKSVSTLLPSRERMEVAKVDDHLRDARSQLQEILEKYGSVSEAIWNHPEKLLSVVDAEGAAIRMDSEQPWMLVGKTPSRKQVERLACWLSTFLCRNNMTFKTGRLSEHYRQGKALRKTACGLLALTIPKADSNLVMWFRPETIQRKIWAGDPQKQVTRLPDGSIRVEPRKSFDDWTELVRLRSRPWRDLEEASALVARNELLCTDLRLQFGLAQQAKIAQRAIQARDEFFSMASHELKTPLTSMRLQSQMSLRRMREKLDTATESERLSRALWRIDKGIDRLIRLVDDMLDISRISSGNLTIVPEKMGIAELACDVVTRMRSQFDSAHVKLQLVRGVEVFGFWDRMRIEQCLSNFLSNALRYGDQSPVTVMAGMLENKAVVSVHDEGLGIQMDVQKRIFNKFERGDRNTQGLGLGLHICQQIVELHGGTTWVESTPGEGSTFCLSLPVNGSAASLE